MEIIATQRAADTGVVYKRGVHAQALAHGLSLWDTAQTQQARRAADAAANESSRCANGNQRVHQELGAKKQPCKPKHA